MLFSAIKYDTFMTNINLHYCSQQLLLLQYNRASDKSNAPHVPVTELKIHLPTWINPPYVQWKMTHYTCHKEESKKIELGKHIVQYQQSAIWLEIHNYSYKTTYKQIIFHTSSRSVPSNTMKEQKQSIRYQYFGENWYQLIKEITKMIAYIYGLENLH